MDTDYPACLLLLASRRRLGHGRLGSVTKYALQGTDLENRAFAATDGDSNGTNSHIGLQCRGDGMHRVAGSGTRILINTGSSFILPVVADFWEG
jgi:hypothetical protein